jgi:WD40-like Beta Propeller Repeat
MKRLDARRLFAAAIAVAVVAGLPAAAAARRSRASAYWIVLASNRDGADRGYSLRSDGTHLTPLLPPTQPLDPMAISRDGSTIAYIDFPGVNDIYVSRANGLGLHKVVPYGGGPVALSSDGKLLAFSQGEKGIAVVATSGHGFRRLTSGDDEGPTWSPQGNAVAFIRFSTDDEHLSLVVQPLRGNPRVLVRRPVTSGPTSPAWSPGGRWIAYGAGDAGLWIVRPDGTGRRRLARGDPSAFAWSPDGARLAYAVRGRHEVVLVNADGGDARRLSLHGVSSIARLSWSPDGRRIAVGAGTIWIVGADGRGLRRSVGGEVVGWTRFAPVRPPAAPLLPSERILDARTIATRGPVTRLSADGGSVAFATATRTAADCDHVVVWTPAARRLIRLGAPKPCESYNSAGVIYELALAGSRAAWAEIGGCGNYCDVGLETATLAQPRPVSVSYLTGAMDATSGEGGAYRVHGRGDLLVFNDDSRLVRLAAGNERCQQGEVRRNICATLRRGDHAAPIDSVAGGLIAIREVDAVSVLDARGELRRVFPFGRNEVRAARLDGGRLVVARSGVLEVYDVATGAGERQRTLPPGFALEDVDGGIAVLRDGKDTIMALRLADGRSLTLTPGRAPRNADLELAGLYYSYATADGGGRVVYVPRSEVERQLRP